MGFLKELTLHFPGLKTNLRKAHIAIRPEEYVKKSLFSSIFVSAMIAILTFFLTDSLGMPLSFPVIAFFLFFTMIFFVQIKKVQVKISKRAKDIDKEVLFAGRFLLVRLNAGVPLINALVEASKSYGIASKYFKEIVRDIELGTPIEKALDNAVNYSASKKFKQILFQINNALKTGTDVSDCLEATLDEISQEQLIEIKRYGKKLNSVTLMYMLVAVVLPSLGMTLFVVIASLTSIQVDLTIFLVFVFFLFIIDIFFLAIFRSIRPNVNI